MKKTLRRKKRVKQKSKRGGFKFWKKPSENPQQFEPIQHEDKSSLTQYFKQGVGLGAGLQFAKLLGYGLNQAFDTDE